jgi:hypothetical protein
MTLEVIRSGSRAAWPSVPRSFLSGVGAIMRFALHSSTRGLGIHTAGTIAMIVTILGVLISLFWMTVWADRRRRVATVDDPYAARAPVVREGEVL